MLRRAEKSIQEHAPKNKALSAMIAEGERLEADTYFWRTQRQGMAVFIAPGLFLHYRLPERFKETFQISRRLHIKPLLPMFHGHGVSIDDQKDEIYLYFQRADKGLRAVLADQGAPLILAGVDYLLDLAAALTIQNSGRVHAMKKESLPDQNAAAAAILRY